MGACACVRVCACARMYVHLLCVLFAARYMVTTGNCDELCEDTCPLASNGICDDGRPNATTSNCAFGTDCQDCSETCRVAFYSVTGGSLCVVVVGCVTVWLVLLAVVVGFGVVVSGVPVSGCSWSDCLWLCMSSDVLSVCCSVVKC